MIRLLVMFISALYSFSTCLLINEYLRILLKVKLKDTVNKQKKKKQAMKPNKMQPF